MTISIIFRGSASGAENANVFWVHESLSCKLRIALLPQCGRWYIIHGTGETMRILFSFLIAFLFMVLVADESPAQMMQHPCQEKYMGGTMKMANCSCLHDLEVVSAEWGPGVYAGVNHCSQPACSGLFAIKDVGLSSTLFSFGLMDMVPNTSFSQPPLLSILGTHRTGVPPPRLPSAPAYLRNCSFLI